MTRFVVADDELRAAAADVHDEEWPVGLEAPGCPHVRDSGLLLAGEDLHRLARQAQDGLGELVAVRGVPYRARRPEMDALRVQRTGPPAVPLQDVERAAKGLGSDAARPVDALTDPGDDHVAGEVGGLARAFGDPSDEEPDRVRSQIDRRDLPAGLLVVDRLPTNELLVDPLPDRIGAAGHEVRVVGVQALDPAGSPTDPSPAFGPGQPSPALLRVLLVGLAQPDAQPRLRLGPLLQP